MAAGTPRTVSHEVGSLRPVVYLPTWARWDIMRQRPQFILAAFARAGHPTFFVDPRESEIREVDGVSIVPSLNEVPANDAILYIHFAPVDAMVERFDRPAIFYDILDDLSIYDEDEAGLPPERTAAYHHLSLIEVADVVSVSNEVLLERHLAERDDIVLVANGVEPERFRADGPRPDDLPSGGPIIGYHGAVASWFAFDLLESVAREEPSWQFVIVGPVDARAQDEADEVGLLENVHFLGERPPDSMPRYVQAFDVGTVWFDVTPMTEGVTPLKVYEYIAAGVPVVSTELPACVAEPAVRTAADAETFRDELREALASREDDEWLSLASTTTESASWSKRLAPVFSALDAQRLRRVE
ncbi:MAG: glycosyltransferase family 1 protein [Acidimicrobiia bacterium]|nr:MAG: glycosyltransferase family 1 protein [Acidimicrobiia bacterium]